MTKEVTPNDLDRAAALSVLFPDDHEAWWKSDSEDYILRTRIECGWEDDHPMVLSFAHHRNSAMLEGARIMRDAASKTLWDRRQHLAAWACAAILDLDTQIVIDNADQYDSSVG